MRRVGIFAQHQRGGGLPCMVEIHQLAEIHLEQGVPVEHQRRLAVEKRFHLLDAPAGSQNHRFARVGDPHAEPRPVAQRVFDERPQMMQVDDHVAEPVAPEQQQVPDDERRAPDRQERLRNAVRQRPQAGPETGRQDHGFHEITSIDKRQSSSGSQHRKDKIRMIVFPIDE